METAAREAPETTSAPPAAPGDRGLRTEGLVKAYGGRRVVDDVALRVLPGEIVGLLGPNGAGKTTSFYCMLGLIRPDAGKVFLRGEDITPLPIYQRARRGISYLPQEPSVFRRMTVGDNLRAILETLDLTSEARERRLKVLLREFGLEVLEGNPAYTLSGGERRRVEIARALVIEPAILLLDEPFAGIDPLAVDEIQKTIVRLRDREIGVLITDHNVRETLKITDSAYIIKDGRIFRHGRPEELAADPEVRRNYLGESFRL